jgi:hypothetical protein
MQKPAKGDQDYRRKWVPKKISNEEWSWQALIKLVTTKTICLWSWLSMAVII